MSGPAWGSIAEWNFSAPPAEARHWKYEIASAPRATVYSDPAKSESEALSYLALGRPLDSIGSDGLPYYVKSMETPEGDAIRMLAQSNPLNICTRPNAVIPLTTP